MAVTHRMSNMLAVSVSLAEEGVSQAVSSREGAGVRRVAQVHHLIHSEERLEAPLLSLSKFL